MKILHTADWHIGKILHKHPLEDELSHFFDWLIQLIQTESIDVLLVSGDVFDLANPAVKDRQMYYQFLSRLLGMEIKVIITGGNHDSVGLLNAPQTILQELKITVVGGATENIADELIEVKNAAGEVELIVAAVPFLRDKDLRNTATDGKYKSRVEAIQEGIKNHYAELAEICEAKYPTLPVIAMGHLYARGVKTSESEREIQIGNTAMIESSIFSDTFDYVALGHIHRPQVIGENEQIRYSGSPIALSFSEKKDHKIVLVVEVENGKINAPQVFPILKQRELKKFKGTLESVKDDLEKYAPDFPLISFVEIEIVEEQFSSLVLAEVEEMVAGFSENQQFKILKNRTHFDHDGKDTSDLFKEGVHIEDLNPLEVFKKKLALEAVEPSQKAALLDAFMELLEMVEQSE
jgi:exonuclease SbcD